MTQNMNNNGTTANQAAAQAAEGMFAKAKNAINSFIKRAPEMFAKFTKGLENVSNMSDEEAAQALEEFYATSADEMDKCIQVAKSMPAYAKSVDVKNMEDLKNAFNALAAEVKESKTASGKIKKAVKLVGSLLFIVGRKIFQLGIAAAKKFLIVGIRITAIAGGFIIHVVSSVAKAVKSVWRFGKALKKVKADEAAKQGAAITVDDLTEEDFEVDC